MCHHRYNFMPLARGSAVVGAMTILAVFLAAGMPITANIPKVSRLAPPTAHKFSNSCRPTTLPESDQNVASPEWHWGGSWTRPAATMTGL